MNTYLGSCKAGETIGFRTDQLDTDSRLTFKQFLSQLSVSQPQGFFIPVQDYVRYLLSHSVR